MTRTVHSGPVLSRRVALSLGALAGLGLLGLRVKAVNGGAVVIPELTYGYDEWLDMGPCFLGTEDNRADGYGFMLIGAEVMSPNSYLSRYSRDGVTGLDGPEGDAPSVIVLDMKIRNESNGDAGIHAFLWRVVSESEPDKSYDFNNELFSHAVPELGGLSGFKVAIGGESLQHFPFCGIAGPDYFQPYDATYAPEVSGSLFRLTMTDLPERKEFQFAI